MTRRFAIHSDDRRRVPGCPGSVPWAMVAPHEAQALRNHAQSLERLHERGGLGLLELAAVLMDLRYHELTKAMTTPHVALALVLRLEREWVAAHPEDAP